MTGDDAEWRRRKNRLLLTFKGRRHRRQALQFAGIGIKIAQTAISLGYKRPPTPTKFIDKGGAFVNIPGLHC
jgi:hypothetical protein